MQRLTRLCRPICSPRVAMVPLLFFVALMAARGLNADVIWYDELTSIGHAGGLTGPFSPLQVAASVSEHSPKHAPLFFELLSAWGALVGWHHIALRCLPLYFGVLAIAWIYRIGVDMVDARTGFWASVFLGMNVFWLDYLHEIRMYTLQFMLIGAVAWHYFFLTRSKSVARWYHWAGLTLSVALSVYAQPFSIFFHAAFAFYHLLFVKKNRAWIRVALMYLAAGLLYLPWLPITLLGISKKFDTAFDAMALHEAVGAFIGLLSNDNWLVLALLLAAAALQLRWLVNRRRVLGFWALAFLIVLILFLANEAVGLIPLRRSRYFFVSFGMWAVVIGNGLARFKYRWLAAIVVVIYLASGFAFRNAEDYLSFQGTVRAVKQYPPLEEYVQALRGKTQPQDYALGFSDSGFVNRRGKHGKSTSDYYLENLLGIDGAFFTISYGAQELEDAAPSLLEDNPYLLFMYNPARLPANFDLAEAVIRRGYHPCGNVLDEPTLFVQRYVYKTLLCDRDYQPIHYDNGIKIIDKFADYRAEDDTVRVVTGWEVADEALLQQYNVSIQIITPDWRNVGQAGDRHLYDDILKWYVAELSTTGLPPGDYRVVVILYDRYENTKVSGVDLNSGEVGSILPVRQFTIEE